MCTKYGEATTLFDDVYSIATQNYTKAAGIKY